MYSGIVCVLLSFTLVLDSNPASMPSTAPSVALLRVEQIQASSQQNGASAARRLLISRALSGTTRRTSAPGSWVLSC